MGKLGWWARRRKRKAVEGVFWRCKACHRQVDVEYHGGSEVVCPECGYPMPVEALTGGVGARDVSALMDRLIEDQDG